MSLNLILIEDPSNPAKCNRPERFNPFCTNSGNFNGSWMVSSNSDMTCCRPPISSQRTSGMCGAFILWLCQWRTRSVIQINFIQSFIINNLMMINVIQQFNQSREYFQCWTYRWHVRWMTGEWFDRHFRLWLNVWRGIKQVQLEIIENHFK